MKARRKQKVPNSPFELEIDLHAPNGAETSRVQVEVRGSGQERNRIVFQAPGAAILAKWVETGSKLMSDLMHTEVNDGTESARCAQVHEDVQRIGEERFQAFFNHQGDDGGAGVVKFLLDLLRSPHLRCVRLDAATEVPGLTIDTFHLGQPAGKFAPDDFLGMRVPVLYQPRSDMTSRDDYDETSVGILSTQKLDTVRLGEVQAELRRLQKAGRIRELFDHTPLRDATKAILEKGDLPALYRLIEMEHRAVWHFASHMRDVGGGHGFELDNGFVVSSTYFGRRECPHFDGEPLVFLNLCAAALPSPAGDVELPERFLRKGAGGVIAPGFLVSESFAALFANNFYGILFDRDPQPPVGEALVAARRAVWRDKRYLTGLAYSFHALQDFAITRRPTGAGQRVDTVRAA